MIVVSDTSPLSALLTVGKLTLLHELFGEILIPSAVYRELLQHHPEVSETSFLRHQSVVDQSAVSALLDTLDPGEAEAIVLAVEQHADLLLIDESLGRTSAMQHDVPIIGLMGILLLAKSAGLLTEVAPIINAVEEQAGFYLGRALKAQILRDAGEEVE